MLTRRARLPRELFGSGWEEAVRTPYFFLKTKKNGGSVTRIGVVAGMTVEKTATKRNFWKRQAKTALARLPAAGRDIVIILSPRVKTLTKKKFSDEVAMAAARLGAM